MDKTFRDELKSLINRFSKENGSDTPDFILADYLLDCLHLFDGTVRRRETWYQPQAKQVQGVQDATSK